MAAASSMKLRRPFRFIIKEKDTLNILFYSPYAGNWYLHTLWEGTIAHALMHRGANVRFVGCDSAFKACDIYWGALAPPEVGCRNCQQLGHQVFSSMHLPTAWVGEQVTDTDRHETHEWLDALSNAELFAATFDGYPLGEWCKASLVAHFRQPSFEPLEGIHAATFRRYLEGGAHALRSLQRHYDEFRPDVVVMLNGTFFSNRVAFELARERRVRVVVHERGLLPETLVFNENNTIWDGPRVQQHCETWRNIPLDAAELEAANAYLHNRRYGKQLAWHAYSPPPQPQDHVRERLGLKPGGKVVTLFTSTQSEASTASWVGVYHDMLEWVRDTVDWFSRNADYHLIIRIHPNEDHVQGRSTKTLERYQALLRDVPSNISVVWPRDDVSSYTLVDLSNAILVYNSTLGLEAAATRGIPVGCVSRPMYHGWGLASDLESREHYPAFLSDLVDAPPSVERRRMALRATYRLYFGLSIPFPQVSVINFSHGELNYASTAELRPGRSAPLDRIADGLMGNAPLYPGPNVAERSRTCGMEDEFLSVYPTPQPQSRETMTMNQPPKVSVVVPCYNYAHYLPAAIESVIQQTYQDFEIIIINDGSTDNSRDVIERLIAAHPSHRISLIDQSNSGHPAISRNRGIEEARGQYILCLDADDMIAPTMLEECVRLLDEHPEVAIAYTDQLHVKGTESSYVATYEYDFQSLLHANYIGTCSLFRRQAWLDTGGYKRMGYEDWEFWIACGEKGHFGKRIPKPLFLYRTGKGGAYDQDLMRDQQIRAQIIMHHLSVYGPDAHAWAQQMLSPPPVQPQKGRIIALLAAYNEGDLIYHVIGDLIANGVDVYLIDNNSTDDTVEQAAKWLGSGLLHIERFPQDAGYPERSAKEYVWKDLLHRKEELATHLDADWYIHSDADEFRESPWLGMSLAEAIRLVDAMGYNAINFELLNFRPINNDFVPGSDVREFLTFYESAEIYNAKQIKAWKNLGLPVQIAASGGHDIDFPGRQVSPLPFLLRHYPIRSEAHGRRKVYDERLPRFAQEERAQGWHVQYDELANGDATFLYDPANLTPYNGHEVRAKLLGSATSNLLLLQALQGHGGAQSPLDSQAILAWVERTLKRTVVWEDIQQCFEVLNQLTSPGVQLNEVLLHLDEKRLSVSLVLAGLQVTLADLRGDGLSARRWAEVRQEIALLTPSLSHEALTSPHIADAPNLNRPGARTPKPSIIPGMTSIVLLGYNQLAYTKLCLESVLLNSDAPFELILVDNGSTDGTGDYFQALQARDTRVRAILNPKNLGFALGCNQGAAIARGEYVLFLNNDTIVPQGWLSRLQAHLERNPDIGALGAVSNCVSGPQQLASVPVANQPEAYDDILAFADEVARTMLGQGFDLTRLVGFCLMVRRSVLDRIGGFDPGFGIGNYEDDDFCLRIQTAGFRTWVAQDVYVHHFGSRTFAALGPEAYSETLEAGWQRFKARWGLPGNLERLQGYRVSLPPFDPTRHHVPLPSPGEVRLYNVPNPFAPGTPGRILDERKGTVFFHHPEWSSNAWCEVLAAYFYAFTSKDDVSLALWLDPSQGVSQESAAERILGHLAMLGGDREGTPDLLLVPDILDLEGLAGLYAAVDIVVPHGDALQAERARQSGKPLLRSLDPEAWREASADPGKFLSH